MEKLCVKRVKHFFLHTFTSWVGAVLQRVRRAGAIGYVGPRASTGQRMDHGLHAVRHYL